MRRFLCTATLILSIAAPSFAQQPAGLVAQPIGYKDPELATLLGVLIVGGGQLYAGHAAKGATLLAIGYGALIGGIAMGSQCHETSSPGFQPYCNYNAGWSWTGIGIFTGSWIYGWATAAGDARQHNAELTRASMLQPLWRRENSRNLVGLSFSVR